VKLSTFRLDDPAPEWFDALTLMAPSHADDDRPAHDGVGQPTKASESDRCVSVDLLRLDGLAVHEATAGRGTLTVTSVEQATDLLVLFGLGSEYCVDLVKQDGCAFV
jgi:hypothetical protein